MGHRTMPSKRQIRTTTGSPRRSRLQCSGKKDRVVGAVFPALSSCYRKSNKKSMGAKMGRIRTGFVSTLSIAAFVSIATVSAAHAADIVLYQDPPSANELADILFPEAKTAHVSTGTAGEYKLRTRGIRFDQGAKANGPNGAGQSGPQQESQHQRPDAFGFNIQFAFNSADIPAQAYPFLDRVADALKSTRAVGSKIVIEGHTDAIGTESYNLALSARRAESVKRYLVEKIHTEGAKLATVAKGKSELLDAREPTSSVNRRVQFRRAQ
jgi:outer membrane protein OmpA-like peptidoglycan-associated protein